MLLRKSAFTNQIYIYIFTFMNNLKVQICTKIHQFCQVLESIFNTFFIRNNHKRGKNQPRQDEVLDIMQMKSVFLAEYHFAVRKAAVEVKHISTQELLTRHERKPRRLNEND